MQRSIIRQSLSLYFNNYFNFTSRTTRRHYWWALCIIYFISVVLGMISGLVGFPWVMALWLIINIIPLISLTFRRLRDVGFTTQGLLILTAAIVISAGATALFQSSVAAFVLQLLVLATVLIPILNTDELATKQTSFFNYFVRTKA